MPERVCECTDRASEHGSKNAFSFYLHLVLQLFIWNGSTPDRSGCFYSSLVKKQSMTHTGAHIVKRQQNANAFFFLSEFWRMEFKDNVENFVFGF